MRKLIIFIALATIVNMANAQELNARVSVNSSAISSTVNKNVFQTLQTALNNFMSNREWTSDACLPNEKSDCSFLVTLQPTTDDNVYTATLTIQAGRPIFNS